MHGVPRNSASKEAEDAFEQYLRLSNDASTAGALHHAFAHGDTRAVLQWRLTDLQVQSQKRYVSPYEFAVLYARLVGRQQAFASLEQAVHQHSPLLFDLQENTTFDSLHVDPHYRAIVQKIGLPPAY